MSIIPTVSSDTSTYSKGTLSAHPTTPKPKPDYQSSSQKRFSQTEPEALNPIQFNPTHPTKPNRPCERGHLSFELFPAYSQHIPPAKRRTGKPSSSQCAQPLAYAIPPVVTSIGEKKQPKPPPVYCQSTTNARPALRPRISIRIARRQHRDQGRHVCHHPRAHRPDDIDS